MKRYTTEISVVLMLAMLLGCGAAVKTTAKGATSERAEVFTEVTDAESRPQGFADVIVKANIKTHEAGYYIGESKNSSHGKPGYPFTINIDGQAAVWKVDGQTDVRPAYDEQGKTSRDPDARTGIKYSIEKKLRLRHGKHKMWFSLPDEDYFAESEITLRDGEEAVVEFKPIYRDHTLPTRMPTFLAGLGRYEIYVNGVKVN